MHVVLYPAEFNCQECTAQDKRFRGCENEATGPGIELNGKRIKRCPVKLIHPIIWEWINLYSHYKQGHLYYAGGVIDQPAKYLQVMSIIGGLVDEHQAEEAKKVKK